MAKSVLITGANRGIGKSIALYLAQAGYDIVLHCRGDQDKLTDLKEQIIGFGRSVRSVGFDINDREKAQSVLLADIEQHGCYYGVVCNAGIARDGAFPALSDDDWDDVIQTNLNGFYNVLKPIIMPMVRTRQPARIVTLSSVSGVIGNRGQVNYSAAKAGIIGATKALAVELAKRKITVNCIAPGLIETDMMDDVEDKQEIVKSIPVQRIGTGNEVASLVNYLLSDDAAYITRQVINVNGGIL